MWGKFIILALLVTPVWAAKRKEAPAEPPFNAEVIYVKDGDTIVIKNPQGVQEDVRLIDINTPEGPHDGAPAEPFADAARTRMRELTLHQKVSIAPARKSRDKYNRLLANVYLPNGDWLNYQMVDEGFAHVYTFADNVMHPKALLGVEQEARAAQRRIWSNPRWALKDAATCCAAEYIGIFQVVQGKVLSVGQGKQEIYLNFGTDYHTDFTVVVNKRDIGKFKKEKIDPLTAYAGKTVRVHGFADPVEGVEMRVTHPAQIEIVK